MSAKTLTIGGITIHEMDLLIPPSPRFSAIAIPSCSNNDTMGFAHLPKGLSQTFGELYPDFKKELGRLNGEGLGIFAQPVINIETESRIIEILSYPVKGKGEKVKNPNLLLPQYGNIKTYADGHMFKVFPQLLIINLLRLKELFDYSKWDCMAIQFPFEKGGMGVAEISMYYSGIILTSGMYFCFENLAILEEEYGRDIEIRNEEHARFVEETNKYVPKKSKPVAKPRKGRPPKPKV